MSRVMLAMILLVGCNADERSDPDPDPAPATAPPPAIAPLVDESPELEGPWRATLTLAGGQLPFTIDFHPQSAGGGPRTAFILNGEERIEPSRVAWNGRELVIGFDVYDSEIHAQVSGDMLTGQWTHTMPDGPEVMPFAATRGERPRFLDEVKAPAHPVPASIDGDWSAVFTIEGGPTFPAQGVFVSVGDRVEGTFLTDTGDYRYLDGRYEQGRLELSCFDGSHAFLLRADVDEGAALVGDFWAMGGFHATWRATKMAPGAADPLADPHAVVALSEAAKDGRFEFGFPDLDGKLVTQDDPRFAGKVVLVDIFGTWCPNCNDLASQLASWERKYGPRGLEVVGLAFEMTGDAQRDRTFVGRYAERYGLRSTLLLAGTSDKDQAAAALPTLTKIVSYPTLVFIGRDGRVQRIHSGFAGPATGQHHTEQIAGMEREIERLLGEVAAG